jgi:hypothetical protein
MSAQSRGKRTRGQAAPPPTVVPVVPATTAKRVCAESPKPEAAKEKNAPTGVDRMVAGPSGKRLSIVNG